MKVWGLHPVWVHSKETTFNGIGMSTTSEKLKIPYVHTTAGIRHCDAQLRAVT